MIGPWLILFAFAKAPCDSVTPVAIDYVELKQKVEKKIADAADLETIANEADSVLAKLIANKSPVLVDWLKERELTDANEEKIAKYWRLYYFQKFVIDRFPTENKAINRSLEGLFVDIHAMGFAAKYKKKLESLLEQVKKDAKKLVRSWPIKKQELQSISHRLDTVQLKWFDKLSGSAFEKAPLDYLYTGLSYDPNKHQVRVGLKTRSYPTEANLYAALAHEISHAFDPCHWGLFIGGSSPFKNIEFCMRDPQSVGAKSRDDSLLKETLAKNLISKELAQTLKQNPTCGNDSYPPRGVQQDQWPEAFADWFAAEVFATSSYNKQLPRPDLCREVKSDPKSSLLPPQQRLLKIYLAQPQLAAQWPQNPPPKHCNFDPINAE